MDPFSITASIITLLQVSAQVTVLVKQFRDEVSVVDTTLNGILNDVDGFQQVLQSMKETFAQEDIQADVQATGHVGCHWKNLARSLSDGESTLDQLRSLLTSVNKSTSFLDASRKQLRLKSAIAQISGFREQIQSYRAALQLSLSTIMVWNQVTLQKSTAKLPEKILPNLNKLYDQIRNLGADLNAKIGRLESTVMNQGFHAESELISMTNLKECVESAADVVSTASTTLGPEGSERASVKYGSDFGDVFRKDSNEPMQRWISSHTVYEYDDVEAPTQDPSEASTGDALTIYESDSESDIEHELVRALFNNGKRRKEQGDLHGAERHLRNCLSRFPTTASYTSLATSQSSLATGVSKAELLEILTETYCLQGSWAQAKSTMKEKLAITERQTGKKSEHFLWDSFRLCEVLMNTKDYTEAQLHGRQALRGFRKLREDGHTGYEKTLVLLVQICNEDGNLEDEEAYAALLGSHRASLKSFESPPASEADGKERPASPKSQENFSEHTQGQSMETDCMHEPIEPPSRTPGTVDKGKQRLRDESTSITQTPTRIIESPVLQMTTASSTPRSFKMQTGEFRRVDSLAPSEQSSQNQSRPTSSKHGAAVSRHESIHREMVSNVSPTISGDTSSSTKLLVSLCQQELGRKPLFMIGRGREGYNCIVFADDSREREIAKATNYLTKEEARHAAAVKAYKTLLSQSAQSAKLSTASIPSGGPRQQEGSASPSRTSSVKSRDVAADPPAYSPSETPQLTSPTGFLQNIPEIMVSPTLNDSRFARPMPVSISQAAPVRRAVSDSRLPSYKLSTQLPAPSDEGSHGPGSRKLDDTLAANASPAHRRAASTSSRTPDWKSGENPALQRPTGLAILAATSKDPDMSENTRKGSNARPNVTFDTIESSVERPDHSNQDPRTPVSKSFSLLPTSLVKTFSLQDRRSKSDDPTLLKKKSRFSLSSRRKSPTTSTTGHDLDETRTSTSSSVCPICSVSLQGLSEDKAWSHVDTCLESPNPSVPDMTYELPASDHGMFAVELPASFPLVGRPDAPISPNSSNQSPKVLSDLHRAFSRRDLSADKFEIEEEARIDPPMPMSPLSRFEASEWQRQVLLLGDAQCGKTWLSHAWCTGKLPKHTSLSATSFTKQLADLEIVIQDYSGLYRIPSQERRASYGVVHAVLLCFDISSPESFENIEHKWNHEADLYLENVPKILVGCKKDINRGGSQTVWTRDAYKLTARINARAYFETSAVTMEGLDALFVHVAQIAPR